MGWRHRDVRLAVLSSGGCPPRTPPIQQPHPPIWIAANNDRAVERAAELGDAWVINPHATCTLLAVRWACIVPP